MERIRADHHADTLPEVSLDELAAWGVTGIVVDLDNTVCAYHRPELAPGVAAWVGAARKRGFALVLVSNNFSERVASIGAQLGIPVVANALKPLPFAFLRALRLLGTPRRSTVVIGDQLFTDVLGAKLLGLRTILTKPLVTNEFPLTRVLRFLERAIAGRTNAAIPGTGSLMERGNNEPKLTETNSDTVLAEDELVDDDRDGRGGNEAPAADATGARTRLGAIPSSYGAPGGTTPK